MFDNIAAAVDDDVIKYDPFKQKKISAQLGGDEVFLCFVQSGKRSMKYCLTIFGV